MALSIATYNVLDLFDPAPADEAGAAALDAKLAYLAKKLREADADVIGLQEIGSETALASLASRLGERTDHTYARVVGTPDARGIRNAILTRLPIVAAEVLTTTELPFPVFVEGDRAPYGERLPLRRGIVQVELQGTSPNERVFVLVVHFKSGRPAPLKNAAGETREPRTASEAMEAMVRSMVVRTAEALFVRKSVDAIFARHAGQAGQAGQLEARVAVVGDFNDVHSSIVFRTVRGTSFGEAGRGGAGPSTELFDATRSIPYERRHSLMHFGGIRAVDHILVSTALHGRIASAQVLNDDLRDHDALRAAAGAVDGPKMTFYDSDHSPVVVRFD